MTDTSASVPAESAPHDATWLAWPGDRSLWGDTLPAAQAEFVALCNTLGGIGKERLHVLAVDDAQRADCEAALEGAAARVIVCPYGDIWMRDTAPVFAAQGARSLALCMRFNGWGGKYDLPGDTEVAGRVAELSGAQTVALDWIGEGGALEFDGAGNCIASECLLGDARNGGDAKDAIEADLARWCGATRVVWVSEVLEGDHTDGHVDTLARFVAPGRVVVARPVEADDPNAETLVALERRLRDESGLEVVAVSSAGRVPGEDGSVLPASHLNYYVANGCVVVPLYEAGRDAVIQELGPLFPGRPVIGLSARAILEGGGAFHCITQQQPAAAT